MNRSRRQFLAGSLWTASGATILAGPKAGQGRIADSTPPTFAIAKSAGYRGYYSLEWDSTGDPFSATQKLIEEGLKYYKSYRPPYCSAGVPTGVFGGESLP